MRNILFILLLSVTTLFAGLESGQAQDAPKFPGLDKSPLDQAYTPRRGAKKIKVIYSRPSKNGRETFGNLAKFGKVWRTGANEATTISFAQDVKFGGKTVKAGEYQLFTIPNEDKWTIILNSESGQWGAYQYNDKANVAQMEVSVKQSANVIENFSISFADTDSGATMYMGWDKTYVAVPFEF